MDEVNEEEIGYYFDMIFCMVCLLFSTAFPGKDYQKSFIEAWQQRAANRQVNFKIINSVSKHFYASMDALRNKT